MICAGEITPDHLTVCVASIVVALTLAGVVAPSAALSMLPPEIVGPVSVLLVRVWVAAMVATVSDAPGNANEVASVPVNVRLLEIVNVLAFASASVPVVELIVRPLIEVANAAPSVGVTNTGDVARASAPVPVLAVAASPLISNELPAPAVSKALFVSVSVVALPISVSVAAGSVSVPDAAADALRMDDPDVAPLRISLASANDFAPVTVSALPSVIAVPDAAGPVNVTPSGIANVAPVAGAVIESLLIEVALATPRLGVVRLGEFANTAAPVPVSSVKAAARLALDAVASHAATPLPSPLMPVATGRPVALVRTPLAGVPSAGVVSVGLAKVPPVIVLPVKVSALGSEATGLPATPSPFAIEISFAVPVMVRAATAPGPVRTIMPFEPSAASASRSASHACTADVAPGAAQFSGDVPFP